MPRARAVHRHLLGRCAGRCCSRLRSAMGSPAPFRWRRRRAGRAGGSARALRPARSAAPGPRRGAARRGCRHAAVGALPGDRGCVAAAQRPEEMLETLVRRLGNAVGASHCACLLPSADRRHARWRRSTTIRPSKWPWISFIIPKRSKRRSPGAPSTRPRCSSIGSSSRISRSGPILPRCTRSRAPPRSP